MKKDAVFAGTALAGVFMSVFIAVLIQANASSLMMMVAGYSLLGFALSEIAEKWFGFKKTLKIPLAITAFSIVGMYALFGQVTLQVLTDPNWCGVPPCLPLGLILVSIVVGNLANFAAHMLAGEKLDLLGES
ncbi:MAG: hypothetical protein JW834_01825 [Candidatus Diapherotrites archaeon]|nr:hypothetical protein [Candidatus Diapherotrites archaeon]